MDPDTFQQAWQKQSSQTRVTVDVERLLKALQRNQREMRSTINWGDLSNIGVSLLMLPVWIYLGVTTGSPWTWYLMVPTYLWIIGFTLVVRARRKKTPNDPGQPLLSGARESLVLVEQQIWLQRNFLWWDLLPTFIPMLVFIVQLSWLKSRDWWDALTDVNACLFLFLLALCFFLDYITQWVVRTQYEPRRQELLTLLASFGDESTVENVAIKSAKSAQSPRIFRPNCSFFSPSTICAAI